MLFAGLLSIAVVHAGGADGYLSPASTFRLLSINLRHGDGPAGSDNLGDVVALIRRVHPDVVMVQEVDQGVARSGGRDQPALLAAGTGMYSVFDATLDSYQGGRYGLLLLTRYSPVSTEIHSLPSAPGREPRIIQEVLVETDDGLRVAVYHTHFGYDDPQAMTEERIAHLLALADTNAADATFVVGDLNLGRSAVAHTTLEAVYEDAAGADSVATYPATDPRSEPDHILYRGTRPIEVVGFHVVTDPVISDHAPIWAEFAVGR